MGAAWCANTSAEFDHTGHVVLRSGFSRPALVANSTACRFRIDFSVIGTSIGLGGWWDPAASKMSFAHLLEGAVIGVLL